MKKFKIPPCQNHSLSPTVEKVPPLLLRLLLRASQPPRYFIAFAAGCFGVLEDEGGVLSALMCFCRKERKDRKGVGMGLRPVRLHAFHARQNFR